MPVKRRLSKVRDNRITTAAIEAFEAGDYVGLHQALGLRPWEPSPLPLDVTPLGVDQGEPPADWGMFSSAWGKAQGLQAELLAVAKRPAPKASGSP